MTHRSHAAAIKRFEEIYGSGSYKRHVKPLLRRQAITGHPFSVLNKFASNSPSSRALVLAAALTTAACQPCHPEMPPQQDNWNVPTTTTEPHTPTPQTKNDPTQT